MRDAVVADDGGGGERADAAAGDGCAEVDDGHRVVWDSRRPHQRLRVESPKRGETGREEGVL